MSNYENTDKMDWFIEKMSSDWFSRQEILALAATDFPDTSQEKLKGTIGQYWSDCTNPKYPAYKSSHTGGRKVEAVDGRRHISKEGDIVPARTPAGAARAAYHWRNFTGKRFSLGEK